MPSRVNRNIVRVFGAIVIALAAQTAYADECSIAKTNKSCTLTIDRRTPLAPPTIQMYPKQTITVVVKNPYYFERYFLDYSSGQLTLAPDVASNIVNGLLPSVKNLNEFHDKLFELRMNDLANPAAPPPDQCSVENITKGVPTTASDITPQLNTLYTTCLSDFAVRSTSIYLRLEPAVAPDAHPQGPAVVPPDRAALGSISKNDIGPLYNKEVALSNAIAAAKNLDSSTTKPPLSVTQANQVRNWVALGALADAVAKDLSGFSARIDDLSRTPVPGSAACSASDASLCVTLYPVEDPHVNNAKMVTRQVTYAVDALNLIQNAQEGIPDPSKKKTIASITILYGDSRWEASAGTFFSTLSNRSFSIAPVLTNGTVTNKQVTENSLHPTVIPFAAANVRISNDFKRPSWRTAFYWTFAVGINPNTVSTDFGTGPSISWRGLMFSALWHAGHDVRLTQGLYKNQLLDSGFSGSATSQNYWRLDRVALGISVRVPSLTGR
jgi:hypothetical protein